MANPKALSTSSEWYKTERNTEALVKAVMQFRSPRSLSGEDIWQLIRLTWVTASDGKLVEHHWQQLKVPALAHLLKKTAVTSDDLTATLSTMHLPAALEQAASRTTGMVNAYRAYRNSLLDWCAAHKNTLRSMITTAQTLGKNDQARYDLARKISQLPKVSTPTGARSMSAANLITPLIACLDPQLRFPIVNGETGVTLRLAKLGFSNHSLEEQVRGFLGIIGRFGITDAFALDTMDDQLIDKITKRPSNETKGTKIDSKGTALPDLDDSEREAILKSQTLRYRRRHNTMTTRLKSLLPRFEMTQGDRQECRFDVLIADYDGKGRDLLIEAKPDPDRGSLRVAVGQLFDYRRFLRHQVGTDLAILTIGRPPKDYVELFHELHITALWFTNQTCSILAGDGEIWRTLETRLAH